MSATGVVLSFERQIIESIDYDLRFVSVPADAQPRPVSELLATVRRAGLGEPTAIAVRNQPNAATQISIGHSNTVYVDPYCGAVIGSSSARARDFFSATERLHRALGAPLGSKTIERPVVGILNLLFGVLIVLGVGLWLPRRWNWKAVRTSITFRAGLRGRAREWNWHNVVGIWFALPLLIIVLTGVVMSFGWANDLLFRMTGSARPIHGREGGERQANKHKPGPPDEPNYEHLIAAGKTLDPDWRMLTINVVRNSTAPISVIVDTGSGGQPQKRVEYSLDRNTAAVRKVTTFASGSLGQRLRAFVRFGHTGEYYGMFGQAIAALASFGACVLVYTGLSLSIRRLRANIGRKKAPVPVYGVAPKCEPIEPGRPVDISP